MKKEAFQWGAGEAADSIRKYTASELGDFVNEMLATRKIPDGVWVFGYGSLMWNPDFKIVETLTGTVKGLERKLCLKSMVYRGTPEYFGLVFGLDRGLSCQGLVFHIAEKDMKTELQKVWEREMFANSYIPTWVDVETSKGVKHAITFIINPEHEHYVPQMELNELKIRVRKASGGCGSCLEYVQKTMDKLNQLGLDDPALKQLCEDFED